MQKIIDFRCRPPFKSFVQDWIFNLNDTSETTGLRTKFANMNMELPNSLLEHSMDAFFAENEASGIVRSVVPLRKLASQENSHLLELLQTYPGKFIGFAGMQPLQDGLATSLTAIETYVINGACTGVYMEPGLDPVPWLVDDTQFFPIYDLCSENNIPLCLLYGGIFHSSDAPEYTYYAPSRIERLARNFPRLKIILSHACWPWTTCACAISLNWKNVYLSPDGFMIDHPGAQDYIVASNYRLQDKMIFGSLYPSVSVDFAVSRYKDMLRPEVWEKIFYRNALRALGMEDS